MKILIPASSRFLIKSWYFGSLKSLAHAKCCKIEIVDSKDHLAQLEAIKSCIKDSFKDSLDEIKRFEYTITVKVLLRRQKLRKWRHRLCSYFNSTTKTVINSEYGLDKYFKEIL